MTAADDANPGMLSPLSCAGRPSEGHGIVHVAPSRSRPLRAARGGLRPALTSPSRRDRWPGGGDGQGVGACAGRVGDFTARVAAMLAR
jgi:hypothetical protein